MSRFSEMNAAQIADLLEYGGAPAHEVAAMYVRAIELLRKSNPAPVEQAAPMLPKPSIIVTDTGEAWDAELNPEVEGTGYYTLGQLVEYRAAPVTVPNDLQPSHWYYVNGEPHAGYSEEQMREALAAAPAAPSADAQDADRYRVLRDPKYQLMEDDPCVTDDSFNTFFEEELDKVVDALKARYAALAQQKEEKCTDDPQ